MNITDDAEEGEEMRQRASLFSSATDFAFGFREGGSRNNMSELGGTQDGEGVIGGEEAKDRVLEGVQGEESVGFGGEEVFWDCHDEHLLETVQV